MRIALLPLLLILVSSGCATGSAVRAVSDNVSVEAHFCTDDCTGILSAMIGSAGSVDCAFYSLRAERVEEALDSRGSSARVVLYGPGNRLAQPAFAMKNYTRRLMHNKFCILNRSVVVTGSFNPSDSAGDDNNLLVLRSRAAATNYEEEFSELFTGTEERRTRKPVMSGNGIRIETYFCPEDLCSERVRGQLEHANKSILFMAFSLTHPGIATELVLKTREGIPVKGVMEKSQNSRHSKYSLLREQGVDVKWDANRGSMHHKVFIIDEEVVITGSFNPTASGDERNDENLVIVHSPEIAAQYTGEFMRVWGS